MNRRIGNAIYTIALGVCTLTAPTQGGALENATIQQINFVANDIVYDRTRNLIYASVPSSQGFPNGNSIVSIDPATLSIVGSSLAGSEPTRMDISRNGERVFVGINGANGFRSWDPGSNVFGPIRPLLSQFGDPAIAENLAVWPGDPSVVVVSKNEVGSTADGDLEVFDDTGSIGNGNGFFNDANQIHFVDNDTLISYNDSSTGFDLIRWSFDGQNLTEEDNIGGLISGFNTQIEVADGIIYASNGKVVDPFTLTALGTFNANGPFEPAPAFGRTYFFDNRVLRVFDNPSFLELDSITFNTTISSDIRTLIAAGDGRLAYLSNNGRLGVISGVMIPEPSSISVLLLGVVLIRRQRNRST